jgi:uncharacterized protein YecE (DUF72 family)
VIRVGTSGFQYKEWKGKFYPRDLPEKKMLGYYAERLNTTEINYTFRRIPSANVIASWTAETPASFRFSLKAPQLVTHIKRLRNCNEVLRAFWNAGSGLQDKLGMVLFQLPPFFKKDATVLSDFLASLPGKMKAAFEFRHESWFDDEVFAALRAKNVALCIADSEKLSTPTIATADLSYFRLRDEGYATKDIKRWAKIIDKHRTKAKDVYVYFKHEETGSGPEFAKILIDALK